MRPVILSAAKDLKDPKDLMTLAMRSLRLRSGQDFAALRRTVLVALAIVTCVAAWPLQAQQNKSPDAALARLLKEAHATLPGACSQASADRLIKILCAKSIRIGIRDYYPLFSTRSGETRQGYEFDGALAIGPMLSVEVEFVPLTPPTPLPLLPAT